MSRPRIAVIGAGMSGLAAAITLQTAGADVTVIEKSRGLGGRVASRRVGDIVVDHGAQNIKPGDSLLHEVMTTRLSSKDLVRIEKPVCLWSPPGTIHTPDEEYNSALKYSYYGGINTIARLLAFELQQLGGTVSLNATARHFTENEQGVELFDVNNSTLGEFRGVVVSAPLPQAADFVANSAPFTAHPINVLDRVRSLRQIEYRSCITVMLGYYRIPATPDLYALLAADRSADLLWLAFESCKGSGHSKGTHEVLVAQMGARFSKYCYLEEDAITASRVIAEVESLLGSEFRSPDWYQVKRWRYSQPVGMVYFDDANPAGSEGALLVCGDGLRPNGGKIHEAYLSGIEAGNRAKLLWL